MKLKITPAYVFTFLMLTYVMSELHEIVHTSVGRLICGCWGKRDFNTWELCETCQNEPWGFIATMVGPIFTFAMAYWGASMLKKNHSIEKQTLGFSLIFANIIFVRLLNIWPFGGGDEFSVLYNEVFIKQRTISLVVAGIIIAIIIFFPLRKAYLFIENKRKIWWIIGFCLIPIIITFVTILVFLNSVLESGFLGEYWILGSPKIVTIWTAIVLTLFLLTRKNLLQLYNQSEN